MSTLTSQLKIGAVVTTFFLSTAVLRADTLVVPNASQDVESESNNQWPFHGLPSIRYHQVYASNGFSGFSGPLEITHLILRPDPIALGGGTFTPPNIQINLSTTMKPPDGLSMTFAENVGLDDTTVYSGALNLSTNFVGPSEGPKVFDVVINLQTPFIFDPAAGNLLLDIRRFPHDTNGFSLDAQDVLEDEVSRLWSTDVMSPTAQGYDSIGLVTQFQFNVVPEPSTLLLGMIVGLIVLAFAGRSTR